jgi:hypothetical protein
MQKEEVKYILFHSAGFAVIVGCVLMQFLYFLDILMYGYVTLVEPNIYILTIEIIWLIFGLIYVFWRYFQFLSRTNIYFLRLSKITNEQIKVWTQEHLKTRLSLWQRIALKINGYVFLRYEKREGWTDYLPFYLVKCDKHGYFEDYPHGHHEYFICPKCEEESKEKWT